MYITTDIFTDNWGKYIECSDDDEITTDNCYQ